MRKVIFPLVFNGNLVQYPDDRSLFRKCRIEGDNVIGQYSGDDEAIETYVKPTKYSRVVTTRDFIGQFSGSQIRAINVYMQNEANPYADDVYRLWTLVTSASVQEVRLDNEDTVTGLSLLLSLALIDQETFDSINQGTEEV